MIRFFKERKTVAKTAKAAKRRKIGRGSGRGKTVRHPKKSKRTGGPASARSGSGVRPAPVGQLREVGVAEVDTGTMPARVDNRYSKGSLQELGSSLAGGQLQPIGVHEEEGGKLVLIYGRRRLLAARAVGLKTLKALVYRKLFPTEIEQLHATENVQRADWNPAEEAEVVSSMVEGEQAELAAVVQETAPVLERRAIAAVADRLGKPVQWVTERAYLARLGGRAKKLVLSGQLPAAHAIEIARLADPEIRDTLAEEAAVNQHREHPLPLRLLRERVARHLMSLEKVPWKLSLPVAGKPACTECPKNTANQAGLFDEGGKRAATGTCTDKACYDAKAKLITREVGKVAKGAAAEAAGHDGVRKAERADTAMKWAMQRLPDAVEPRAVKQQVEEAVGDWKPKASEAELAKNREQEEKAAKEQAEKRARSEAEHKLYAYELERAGLVYAALVTMCKRREGLRAVLILISETAPWCKMQANRHGNTEADRKRALEQLPTLLAAIADPALSHSVLNVARLLPKAEGLPFDDHAMAQRPGVVDAFAEVLELADLPPRKTVGDFLSVEFGGMLPAAADGKAVVK
jgi:ParB/RepB/Spo0J family partition protein